MGKVRLEQLMLEQLMVESRIMLDKETLRRSLKISSFIDDQLLTMVYRIEEYVMAEEVDNRSKVVSISLSFPVYKNWWQHFKGEMFPDWLKRRFPPQLNCITKTGKKTVTFRRLATYPKANIMIPDKVGDIVVYRSELIEREGV